MKNRASEPQKVHNKVQQQKKRAKKKVLIKSPKSREEREKNTTPEKKEVFSERRFAPSVREGNNMGKLLSLLARDNSSGDCCGPKSNCDIFLDFENAQPTQDELAVYDEVAAVHEKSKRILEEIQVYKVSHSHIVKLNHRHLNNICLLLDFTFRLRCSTALPSYAELLSFVMIDNYQDRIVNPVHY